MKKVDSLITVVARISLLGALVVIGASCTASREVACRNYDKMPSKPSSFVMRSVLKSVPYTRNRAFYGNYGGSGCLGGVPTDEMDEYFRRHDVVYALAKSTRTMRQADQELVKALKGIDDESLTEGGREYRDRAIKFMESSASALIGKPLTAVFWQNEPSGSHFSDPDSVRLFFEIKHLGSPGSESEKVLPVSMKAEARMNEVSQLADLKNK